VGGVLAGHTLGSPLPSPAPGGLGGLLNAFGRRPSPASPEADAIIERGGRPARFGLTATWNAWMAMRYRAIIAPPTFELLVGPWVSVVGPLPPA
jgi:hypothetical protein